MHAAVVALSRLPEMVIADHMTRTFGVECEAREMGRDQNPTWAIVSILGELVAEFSAGARNLEADSDQLIADFVRKRGRRLGARLMLPPRRD